MRSPSSWTMAISPTSRLLRPEASASGAADAAGARLVEPERVEQPPARIAVDSLGLPRSEIVGRCRRPGGLELLEVRFGARPRTDFLRAGAAAGRRRWGSASTGTAAACAERDREGTRGGEGVST